MIRSLEDAQQWYEAVRKLVSWMQRMGTNYWGAETETKTLREVLNQDGKFRHVEADEIQDLARLVLDNLDDLAVLLMFSVFEADVRQRTLDAIDREVEQPPRQLVLREAYEKARDRVQHGSFGNLTNSYKGLDSDQKSLVDQVRGYRNWVAHGRRDVAKNNITPEAAFDRLRDFLDLLGTHLDSLDDSRNTPEG